jgi:hypothetical protein
VAGSLQALGGVFLGSHAVAEGVITRAQVQSGLYRRLFQNVYADPALTADHRLYARGAMLLMPPDAVLGGGPRRRGSTRRSPRRSSRCWWWSAELRVAGSTRHPPASHEVNPAEVIEFDGDRVRRLRGRRPRHDAAPDGLGDRHPGVPGRSRRTARRDGPGRSRGRRLARPTRAWRTRRWGRSASRRSCHSSTGASPASSRGSPGPSAHRCSRADRRPSFRYRRLGRQPQLSVPKAGGRPT